MSIIYYVLVSTSLCFIKDETLKSQMQNFMLSTQSQMEISSLDTKVRLLIDY